MNYEFGPSSDPGPNWHKRAELVWGRVGKVRIAMYPFRFLSIMACKSFVDSYFILLF